MLDSHMSLLVYVDFQNEEVRFNWTLNETLIDSLPPFSSMLSLGGRNCNSYCTYSDVLVILNVQSALMMKFSLM